MVLGLKKSKKILYYGEIIPLIILGKKAKSPKINTLAGAGSIGSLLLRQLQATQNTQKLNRIDITKMLSEFEKKVADFTQANGLFDSVNKVLLAVSGGADSMALLYAVLALKAEGIFNGDIICAHINHRLRGSQADADEDFVVREVQNLNLQITTRRLDVRDFARKNKLSLETAARKLRIESLIKIAGADNCNCIAAGHQKDDNAETVVQRLCRGTGLRGLGGIWPVRVFEGGINFVRPLLVVTRSEIVEYLSRRNLQWRTDKTNEDCKYRRNFIRHRLIPQLQQQYRGPLAEQLFELSRSARKLYATVGGCADKVWPSLANYADGGVVLKLSSFSIQPEPVKVELIRRSLTSIGSGERDLIYQHYERILRLAEKNISNKKVELPNGFTARREYGNLIFARTKDDCDSEKQISKAVQVKVPGRTRLGDYLVESALFEAQTQGLEKFKAGKNSFVGWFDFDKVRLPLVVRPRKAGERFWPLGLGAEKKVGKFLTAMRVPQRIRRKTLIVADAEKVIWVWPIRVSEQTKITRNSRKVLRLQITDAALI